MSEYMWVILQSLNWSDIVLGLILAAITYFAVWGKSKRQRVVEWNRARKERAEAIRNLPGHFGELSKSLEEMAKAKSSTSAHLVAINEQLTTQGRTLQSQNLMLADISAMAHGQMELDSVPRFICDNFGRNRYVNTAFARLIGCGRDELDGFGYQSFFPPSLNAAYYTGFREATGHHRAYEGEVVMLRTNGSRALIRVRVVPHPEDVPPATHWNGMLHFIREMPADE